MGGYVGRFAPSPTGPLHAGSLVVALASWLDARAHGGKWLVRIEDVDTPRTVHGAAEEILRQLYALGLVADEPPVWQSTRSAYYETALQSLREQGLLYACRCSRKDIEEANLALGLIRQRNAEWRYLSTCRHQATTPFSTDTPYSLRMIAEVKSHKSAYDSDSIEFSNTIKWQDRRLGAHEQDVQKTVGDFVLKRADGCYTYQLAVVVDDALQGITHVVRGEDLADNTARQILLQQHLGYATPQYLHTPLVLAANGEKLSKQNGAQALNTDAPMPALNSALDKLGLQTAQTQANHLTPSELLSRAINAWRVQNCA